MVIFHSYVSLPEGNDLKNLHLICTSQNATWVTESPAPVVPSPGTRHAPRRTWGPKMRHADWVKSHWGDKYGGDFEWQIGIKWSSLWDSHPMVSAAHLMLFQSFPFSRDASTPTFPFEAPAFFASAPCSSAASALWQTSASSVARAMAKPLQNKLDVFGINASKSARCIWNMENWWFCNPQHKNVKDLLASLDHILQLLKTSATDRETNQDTEPRQTKTHNQNWIPSTSPSVQQTLNHQPASDAHWNNTWWYHSYHLSPFTYAFNGRCPSFNQ